jgi:adenylylsulfate kinase
MTQMNKSSNTVWHNASVTRQRREQLNGHKSVILWFTGLSGSGKSTLAHALEEDLYQRNCRTIVLDGDNVRHGLCSDLGFSDEDRKENIRRIAELSKLTIESGVIALTAFISPFKTDRDDARGLVDQDDLIEIFCECPLHVCEKRDVKGLYRRARKGEIKEFTGISSPYEEPNNAEIRVNTSELSIQESVDRIVAVLEERGIIRVKESD